MTLTFKRKVVLWTYAILIILVCILATPNKWEMDGKPYFSREMPTNVSIWQIWSSTEVNGFDVKNALDIPRLLVYIFATTVFCGVLFVTIE